MIGIFVVGNPVIDTLPKRPFRVLATLHRRENWGTRLSSAIETLKAFTIAHHEVTTLLIRHPNWNVALPDGEPESRDDLGFYIDRPLPRKALLDEMEESDVVVTDSGGLQEEAAHFGTDCIVVRTATERTALLQSGAVTLVSPDSPDELRRELEQRLAARRCYGSGDAGERIAEILLAALAREG